MLSSWVSRRNGGVFEAVVAQSGIVRDLGGTPVVIGLREASSVEDLWRLEGVETHLVDPSGPAALGFSHGFAEALEDARLDLVHLHGIWQYPTRAAGEWANAHRKPLVISPHGMMTPWITRRNAWKKHLARALWERGAWRSAAAFHALTDAEAAEIAVEAGSIKTGVIPNPAPPLSAASDVPRGPTALYIGRIHEKKNIAGLVSGWLQVRERLPEEATLVIAGWGDSEGIKGLEQAMREHSSAGIEFVGTAFGSQKAALFDLARALVLPSFSEGLPMAVLEGWSAGVPAVMSTHCNLPVGFAEGAALDCGTDPGSIGEALHQALTLPEEQWLEMSAAARALASGPFSAETIARQWEEFYLSVLKD